MIYPPPYYQDDRVTLYHGEAVDVMRSIEPCSVDLLMADPPYSSGGMVRGDRTQGVHTKYVQSDSTSGQALPAFSGDNRDQRGYLLWSALWLDVALEVMRPGSIAALFTDWRQLPTTTDALQVGGFVWRGVVPWHKPNARPQQGRPTAACEYVVWGTAGARELTGSPFPGFYAYDPPRANLREHITQKPLQLMVDLMAIAPPGGVVLDPFVGSGTTLVAARGRGLRAIGIERTERLCEVAALRLSSGDKAHRATGTADLFAETGT